MRHCSATLSQTAREGKPEVCCVDVVEALARIPRGRLRSYTWVAQQLGYEGPEAARAAGQAISRETLRRYPTPERDEATAQESFPWWRVVGISGDVRTVLEDHRWFQRQVTRLLSEGHELRPSLDLLDGLRVASLPADFE